jgi:hypothetical protein
MTRDEWLASEDPAAMLGYYTGTNWLKGRPLGIPVGGSNRKLRLWMCAVTRLMNWTLPNVGERLAEAEAWADGGPAPRDNYFSFDHSDISPAAESVTTPNWGRDYGTITQRAKADALRDTVGDPFAIVALPGWRTRETDGSVTYQDCPWLTPQVLSLAQAAYSERVDLPCFECNGSGRVNRNSRYAPETGCMLCRSSGVSVSQALDPFRLAVLADALEEAGVPQAECGKCIDGGVSAGYPGDYIRCRDCDGSGRVPSPLLAHLRANGPHFRGMWSLDLVLGKE